jgi:hypothetical protein
MEPTISPSHEPEVSTTAHAFHSHESALKITILYM